RRRPGRCRASFLASKNWLAEQVGEKIVKIEVQLGDETKTLPAFAINWNDRFSGQLHMLPRPDKARIDRARCPAFSRSCWRRQIKFNHWRQMRDNIAEPLV